MPASFQEEEEKQFAIAWRFGNTQGIKVLGADEEMKKENPKSSNVTQIFHFQSSNQQKLMESTKKFRDMAQGPWCYFLS